MEALKPSSNIMDPSRDLRQGGKRLAVIYDYDIRFVVESTRPAAGSASRRSPIDPRSQDRLQSTVGTDNLTETGAAAETTATTQTIAGAAAATEQVEDLNRSVGAGYSRMIPIVRAVVNTQAIEKLEPL